MPPKSSSSETLVCPHLAAIAGSVEAERTAFLASVSTIAINATLLTHRTNPAEFITEWNQQNADSEREIPKEAVGQLLGYLAGCPVFPKTSDGLAHALYALFYTQLAYLIEEFWKSFNEEVFIKEVVQGAQPPVTIVEIVKRIQTHFRRELEAFLSTNLDGQAAETYEYSDRVATLLSYVDDSQETILSGMGTACIFIVEFIGVIRELFMERYSREPSIEEITGIFLRSENSEIIKRSLMNATYVFQAHKQLEDGAERPSEFNVNHFILVGKEGKEQVVTREPVEAEILRKATERMRENLPRKKKIGCVIHLMEDTEFYPNFRNLIMTCAFQLLGTQKSQT